jgi:hypothetical protein
MSTDLRSFRSRTHMDRMHSASSIGIGGEASLDERDWLASRPLASQSTPLDARGAVSDGDI